MLTSGNKNGGHVMPSAQPATKLSYAKLTAKSQGSQSGPPTAHPTPGLPPSRTLARPHKQPPRGPYTEHPTPSLPPSRNRRLRFRGAADERERGPRGARRGGRRPHRPQETVTTCHGFSLKMTEKGWLGTFLTPWHGSSNGNERALCSNDSMFRWSRDVELGRKKVRQVS